MDFIDCKAILTTDILEVDPLIYTNKFVHEQITDQRNNGNIII